MTEVADTTNGMVGDILDDDDFTPPGKPDFRRVGRWKSPSVVMPNGKRSTYGRFSNAGKILDDESNLTDWKLRTVIVGAANRPELMAQVSTLDPKADKNELRDISEECLTAGKGRERTVKGVAVHAMFDHLDLDDGWEPAPQWLDLCISYTDKLVEWGLVPVDVEVNCVLHAFRLAGRMDRRYKTTKVLVAPDNRLIPIGSMVAADTKTGQVLEYAAGSYATQLAGYANADRYDVETDETIPFDPPTYKDWGLVVHADSGGTEVQMYWVDLNAGLEGLKLSQEVKQWRQRADLLHLGAGPVLATSAPVPQEAPVVPQVPRSSGWDPMDHPDPEQERAGSLWLHTRDRVKAILEHSDIAGKALARAWPAGIPGLKQGGHSIDQLEAIIEVVERVETDYSVPFFPAWNDPAITPAVLERHPSWVKPKPEPVEPPPITLQDRINDHPRVDLLRQWVGMAVKGGIDYQWDTSALGEALLQFASIDTSEWGNNPHPDEALSIFLEGTLRALGYKRGLMDLGQINPEHAPAIMSAVFSITAGTGVLLYGEDGNPVFRSNVVKG